MKVVTVIGARPQFVKAAMVSKALTSSGDIREIIIHTGQHFDNEMSKVFFDEMGLREPDYNLGIHSLTHGAMTGRMMERIEEVLIKEKPDSVLVYGDTNSTLAGALAASKLHIPVAHVEAGLRSFNRDMPEEINRVLTDHVSDLLFVPTEGAVQNLLNEGISGPGVQVVGDVMLDATVWFTKVAGAKSEIIEKLSLTSSAYVLATIHRAENTDNPEILKNIVRALKKLNERLPVVVPMHPRTRNALERHHLALENVRTIDPVGYLDMLVLEKQARLILTDSGGVQKEAYFHRVPCVTIRNETEWTELTDSGWNVLAPPVSAEGILQQVDKQLSWSPGEAPDYYGDGYASEKIAEVLYAQSTIKAQIQA